MNKTLVIGIAGGSGSGKSTVAELIQKRFSSDVQIIHHDNYYKSQDDKTMEERVKQNYDAPEAFETDLMVTQLEELLNGNEIECPVYDYENHTRFKNKTEALSPSKVLIIDGILILAEEKLRKLMDIKIFVDTDADVRVLRRAYRDMTGERKRTFESVMNQYLTTVKPMHELYVEPSKKYADIIIPEGGHNLVALSMLETRIESFLSGIE